jgi:hypothetical protein
VAERAGADHSYEIAIDPATDFGEEQQTHHGIDLEDNRQVVQVGQFPLVAGLQVDDRARGSSADPQRAKGRYDLIDCRAARQRRKVVRQASSMPPPLVGTTIAVSVTLRRSICTQPPTPTRLTYREIISMKPPSQGKAQGNNGIRASAMSHPIPMKSSWLTVARSPGRVRRRRPVTGQASGPQRRG